MIQRIADYFIDWWVTLQSMRILMPCIWKAIMIWNYKPGEEDPLGEKFLREHYPLEMNKVDDLVRASCRRKGLPDD